MKHPIVTQALELLAREAHETDTLASPNAVRDYLRLRLGDKPHEVFAVVFLNAQHRVIATEEMFRGTLTQTSVYPREVVIEALRRNAAAVVLCHNHPSGSLQPSQADLDLTKRLRKAGEVLDLTLLDHLIVSERGFYSFADEGLL